MDFLIRWMEKLTQLSFLLPPFCQSRSCLLYADDTLLLLRPTRTQLVKAELMLRIFGLLSGLKVNMVKSELSVTAATPFFTQTLAAILQCKPATFPLKYLGLPLSHKKLTKSDYLPLIEKIRAKLMGWKASLLSIGGRIVLINSVLTAIPQFFMSMFLLPKWVIRMIDKIRRAFFWHGHREHQGMSKGLCMANWAIITRPKNLGGLGIRDIHITNRSLLAKWIWLWHDPNYSWWREATPVQDQSEKPWTDPRQSAFWKGIVTAAPAFQCSVKHHIQNGKSTQFWHDNWQGSPLKFSFPNLYRMAQYQSCSVNWQVNEIGWIIQSLLDNPTLQSEGNRLLALIQQVQITTTQDQVTWLRNTSSFTVSSLYSFMSNSPSPNSLLKNMWAIKAPLRVMVFAWLMLNNRLTTIDNLTRRGWCIPNMCIMCKQHQETTLHLFQSCTVAAQTRIYTQDTFPHQTPIPAEYTSADSFQIITDMAASKIAKNLEITTCFVLWRERCRRIFSEKFSTHISLVREIRAEFQNWFGNYAFIDTGTT